MKEFRIPLRAFLLFGLFLLCLSWSVQVATGQSGNIVWFEPINLSNTPTPSAHPAIVSDAFGYVHVFWSEEVGVKTTDSEEDIQNTGNTIFYRRWDGVSWTPSIDVLFSPDGILAEFPAVDIDVKNRLHLVWIGTTNLYYSNAQSWKADSVHAWSTPLTLAYNNGAIPWGSDIAADNSGGLHVIYATGGDEAGIYYIRSVDGGKTWARAIRLSNPLELLEEHFSTVKIIVDVSGYLHAVWETNQVKGYGQAIYYARSTDKGDNWSVPLKLGEKDSGDYETAWPYLTNVGKSELHLIYVDGPDAVGRSHRISKDGGKIWSEPVQILTEMVGVNGYIIPIVDSAKQIHLIINMRTRDTQTVGIYYAYWLKTSWSTVIPVDVSIPSAHYTAAVIRLGNEIHVVYTQHAGGEIWHISGIIPQVSQILPLPLPKIPPPTPEATKIALPTPIIPISQSKLQPVSSTTSIPASSIPGLWLLPGVGASLLVITSVIIWKRIRSRLI